MYLIFIIGIISNGNVIHNKVKCITIKQMSHMLLKKYDDINEVLYVRQIGISSDRNIPYVKKIKDYNITCKN